MEFHVVEKLRPSTVHHSALTLRFTALVQAPGRHYITVQELYEKMWRLGIMIYP